jgi:hypothetical protein
MPMPRHQVTASAVIPAPAAQVYGIIADYSNGHPRIIPRPPFVSLEVEQGGIGAGTVIRFQMRVLGRTRTFRAAITESEPGRVLVETDLDMGPVTRFTVDPCEEGRHARVTIQTDLETRGGPLGVVERFLITRMLQPVYVRELAQLAAVAASREPAANADTPSRS